MYPLTHSTIAPDTYSDHALEMVLIIVHCWHASKVVLIKVLAMGLQHVSLVLGACAPFILTIDTL